MSGPGCSHGAASVDALASTPVVLVLGGSGLCGQFIVQRLVQAATLCQQTVGTVHAPRWLVRILAGCSVPQFRVVATYNSKCVGMAHRVWFFFFAPTVCRALTVFGVCGRVIAARYRFLLLQALRSRVAPCIDHPTRHA